MIQSEHRRLPSSDLLCTALASCPALRCMPTDLLDSDSDGSIESVVRAFQPLGNTEHFGARKDTLPHSQRQQQQQQQKNQSSSLSPQPPKENLETCLRRLYDHLVLPAEQFCPGGQLEGLLVQEVGSSDFKSSLDTNDSTTRLVICTRSPELTNASPGRAACPFSHLLNWRLEPLSRRISNVFVVSSLKGLTDDHLDQKIDAKSRPAECEEKSVCQSRTLSKGHLHLISPSHPSSKQRNGTNASIGSPRWTINTLISETCTGQPVPFPVNRLPQLDQPHSSMARVLVCGNPAMPSE
ncbi:unnamed protein product [Protopolystoma xenopodis]|uniref:Uncharacterized protein n=1 Tax=Protopolystoma xenopodis TaxID=117903 RepID=A0A448X1E7_9PLAT|nr:unnamed protein product [Protopolystoma xenopodis]